MRPFPRLTLALVLSFAHVTTPVLATEWMRSRPSDAASRSFERGPVPRASARPAPIDEGAMAQARMEAQQRIWDQKMKALSGSICTGC
jgi:hypothetical protein